MKNEEVMLHKFGRRFSKGAVLFRDGDSSKEMYVIHSGRGKIKKQGKEMFQEVKYLGFFQNGLKQSELILLISLKSSLLQPG